MQLFVLLVILATTCSTLGQREMVRFSEKDAKVRRHAVSYSTSVIHKDPKYPDQHAESSINVDFGPQDLSSQQAEGDTSNQPSTLQQNYINVQQRKPRIQQAYGSNNNLYRQLQYTQDQKESIPDYNNVQKGKLNSEQSQSFNVGYSVKFTDSHKQPTAPSIEQNYKGAEIITGSKKEPVGKPSNNFESFDFVNNALIDLKKQKLSGRKLKPSSKPTVVKQSNDANSFVGILSPKTQQFLSYLGNSEQIVASNTNFGQQLQNTQHQTIQNSNQWTNLSPSVEIYHSREMPQSLLFTPLEQMEQSRKFDHAGALGKSQGFDYSNAINDGKAHQEPIVAAIEHHPNHVPLIPAVFDFTSEMQPAPLVVPFSANMIPVANFPMHAQELTPQIALIPTVQTATITAPSNVPITSNVLREPILPTNGRNLPNNPHTTTIPFDTALLQAVQQKLLTSSAQPVNTFDVTGKGQVHASINEQQHPKSKANKNSQTFKQLDSHFKQPNFRYGSQQAHFLKKDYGNKYYHNYDKIHSEEERYPDFRSTKINKSSKTRPMKMKAIPTDLLPPPLKKFKRRRRMYKVL